MRFAIPFALLAVGAQALANPLAAKRASLDVCASIDAGLNIKNPLTGGPLVIGVLGQFYSPKFCHILNLL